MTTKPCYRVCGPVACSSPITHCVPAKSSTRRKSLHAIVAFNARALGDSRVEQVLLSVRDGVMLVRKN